MAWTVKRAEADVAQLSEQALDKDEFCWAAGERIAKVVDFSASCPPARAHRGRSLGHPAWLGHRRRDGSRHGDHRAGNTVQDHLKAIFEKVGVHSRKDLMRQVFFEHFLPRITDHVTPAANGMLL